VVSAIQLFGSVLVVTLQAPVSLLNRVLCSALIRLYRSKVFNLVQFTPAAFDMFLRLILKAAATSETSLPFPVSLARPLPKALQASDSHHFPSFLVHELIF
jgi:hypothetical protein